MKSSTVFSLLAFASSAVSSPLAAPELKDRTIFPICAPQDQVLVFAGLNKQFCSSYLQPTSTANLVKTVLATAFATATSTQTVFATSTSIPVPTVICNVAGYAQAQAINTFFNNDGSFTSAQCQAQCLAVGAPTFASGGTLCACYAGSVNNVVGPAAGAPYNFSDVKCPVAVSAPVAVTAPAAPVKRDDAPGCASAASKIPPFLIQKLSPAPARLTSACECVLNNDSVAPCVITKITTVTSTTTIVQTQTATTTHLVVVTAS